MPNFLFNFCPKEKRQFWKGKIEFLKGPKIRIFLKGNGSEFLNEHVIHYLYRTNKQSCKLFNCLRCQTQTCHLGLIPSSMCRNLTSNNWLLGNHDEFTLYTFSEESYQVFQPDTPSVGDYAGIVTRDRAKLTRAKLTREIFSLLYFTALRKISMCS